MSNQVLLCPPPVISSQRTLNFVLTGQSRSGSRMLQTALASHRHVHCHGDLLDASDRTRKATHLGYFGDNPHDHRPPDYCEQGHTDGRSNPERYLSRSVFDRPLNGELAIGVRLQYHDLHYSDLWDYLGERYRDGDFCVIHVQRNPLASYVSQLQAERDRYHFVDLDHEVRPYSPSSVRVDPDAFIAYCHRYQSDHGKIELLCPDTLVVSYRDLCFRFDESFQRVCRYLEVPYDLNARPQVRRLQNRVLSQRVSNFAALMRAVPQSMRVYFQTDLY